MFHVYASTYFRVISRSLGSLNYARVWHDNSGKGKFGSWYLTYLVVRDVQTDEKHVFICNRWFAVEEDDGQVGSSQRCSLMIETMDCVPKPTPVYGKL